MPDANEVPKAGTCDRCGYEAVSTESNAAGGSVITHVVHEFALLEVNAK